MNFSINNIIEDNTYCEAFSGVYSRFITTAIDKKRLKRAACLSLALWSTVFDKSVGGIEAWLDPGGTPDGRQAIVLPFMMLEFTIERYLGMARGM